VCGCVHTCVRMGKGKESQSYMYSILVCQLDWSCLMINQVQIDCMHFLVLSITQDEQRGCDKNFIPWEAKGLTWIKHPERERRGDSCKSSTLMGWNSRSGTKFSLDYSRHPRGNLYRRTLAIAGICELICK